MWHKPCRTFHPWCPCIKTRCLFNTLTKRPTFCRKHCVFIEISQNFLPRGQINNMPALVWIKAFRQTRDKPLFGPVMALFAVACKRHSASTKSSRRETLTSYSKQGMIKVHPTNHARMHIQIAHRYVSVTFNISIISISFRVSSLPLWQSHGCSRTSRVTVKDTNQQENVCIIHGIYCIQVVNGVTADCSGLYIRSISDEICTQLSCDLLGCRYIMRYCHACHDDVIKWKHFPCYWPFVRGIRRSPVNSPHKGQWHGALMFSLICARLYRQ